MMILLLSSESIFPLLQPASLATSTFVRISMATLQKPHMLPSKLRISIELDLRQVEVGKGGRSRWFKLTIFFHHQ